MLLRRFKYPKTTGLILRKTYKQLRQSHELKLLEEFPEVAPWYNLTRHELALPNGSWLFFGSAEHPQDMSAFYSSEYADIFVDEAQTFSQYELEQLSGSNRCTSNMDLIPKTVYSFMPGMDEDGLPPIGLSYLKRVFVDASQPAKLADNPRLLTPQERKRKWAFVPARAWDNIEWARKALGWERGGGEGGRWRMREGAVSEEEYYSWPEKDREKFFIECTEYGIELSALSDAGLRNAWLYGEFNTFQGLYFQNWDERRHVITPAEARERIKPWHKKWPSGDWGFEHPSCIHWHAQDEHGRVITYREMWGRQIHETTLGKNIARLSGWIKVNGKWQLSQSGDNLQKQAFPFSWDAGKLSTRSAPDFPKSINQMISDALPEGHPKPHPADSSPGSRIAGARLMSNLLDTDIMGLPAWQVVESDDERPDELWGCPHLIECLPSLIRDPDNREDVLKIDFEQNKIGDDPYDSARMGLQFMLGAAVLPVSEVAQRRVHEFAKSRGQEVEDLDINTVAQLHRRAMMQETQKRHERKGGLGKVWRPQVN